MVVEKKLSLRAAALLRIPVALHQILAARLRVQVVLLQAPAPQAQAVPRQALAAPPVRQVKSSRPPITERCFSTPILFWPPT